MIGRKLYTTVALSFQRNDNGASFGQLIYLHQDVKCCRVMPFRYHRTSRRLPRVTPSF